jgi:hypothetical protein
MTEKVKKNWYGLYRIIGIIILAILLVACIFLLVQNCLLETRSAILQKKIIETEAINEIKNNQIEKYEILFDNFNLLYSTVFYGNAFSSADQEESFFTGFSMFYKEKFYIISAGHCVSYSGVEYNNFRFKANNSEHWFSPELLYFENDDKNNKDFSIFYYDLNRLGLMIETEDMEPEFVLGNSKSNINILKEFDCSLLGESGSPILSQNCKLVGVVIKSDKQYTPITEVIRAIDNLVYYYN